MHRVLLIRQIEEALPLAKLLELKGIESCVYPLFEPIFLSIPSLEKPQGLIITSKNALRAIENELYLNTGLPRRCAPRNDEGGKVQSQTSLRGALLRSKPEKIFQRLQKIPLYTVGDQTAQFAHSLGFSKIFNASGTSQDLIHLILQHAQREKGILWHLSGEIIKGNIVETLQSKGFEAERHIVYGIDETKNFPPALLSALQNQMISHVMFFSPRRTTNFVTIIKKNKLEEATRSMTSLCLSQDVAEKAAELNWGKIWISPQPTTQNMMRYFDAEK